ncbi:MAG: alpha/beta fold hydrolase [Candidatus Binataceae bacterium]
MTATHVLVHGAWHGGWCWAAVQNQLSLRGDRSFAVDLPGHGQDQTDRSKVTYDAYVNSVVKLIEERELRDVVLSGHSLGGLTIAGVAARIPSRIKRTVFVSAIVPLDRQRLVDPDNQQSKALIDAALARPDQSLPVEMMGPAFYQGLMNDVPAEMRAWIDSCLCPQPLGPMIEPIPMTPFHGSGVPTAYLVCENDATPVPGAPGWHPHFSSRLKNPALRFIDCGHELMFTRPVECAAALYDLARI